MQQALPKPISNADSEPYWAGARARKLLIRKCANCGEVHFMPRHLCPKCWSDKLEWIEARGTGAVHSFSIIRRASHPAFVDRVPYVTAMIELDEGPWMVTNIVGPDALDVRIGDRVSVTFEDRGDGDLVPQFQRVQA